MVDKDIFKFWLHNIWFKYIKLHGKKKSLLILDRATSHYYENISDDFKRNEGNYVLIPPGLTRFLQPLDISINFPFKNDLKKKYINFNLFKMNCEKAKPEDIINFIYEIWYDNNEIKTETIIKSFKSAGITDDFEKSESKRNFKWPVEVCPKIELKNYLDINLKNNSENQSNFEKIKDDYAGKNASEDLQPCIDEIFPKIKK